MTTPLVEIRNLKKTFTLQKGLLQGKKSVCAVNNVSFSIGPQESFGIVGESGCGKSTLGRLLLALEKPDAGTVLFEGENIYSLPKKQLRMLRRQMQIIFQDPFSSLNPRMTVSEIVAEPLIIHRVSPDKYALSKRLKHLVSLVGLAESHLERYPHEFSGGQRQRIGIARALALNPKLIVADEPVSALDVSIQAQILNLLKDLQEQLHLTYLFISHDLSVVRHMCDRVAVMYLGKVVELGEAEEIFQNPQHPYTEALLSAVPVPNPEIERSRKRILLSGDLPDPFHPPSGCHFHPRCQYAQPSCRAQVPELAEILPGHKAACPIQPFKDKTSAAALVQPG